MHVHLDPVGGVAGDMFVAALLDLRPDLATGAIAAVRAAGLDPAVGLAHVPFSDGILSGSRFEVSAPAAEHDHQHVHWSSLRARLQASALPAPVCAIAVGIFTHLAEAEARVHDEPVDGVAFHEVGAWDSVADIVAAAHLIDALAPCTWSIGAIPAGSGRVDSQHGLLPVPAPATVLLLEGFDVFDDGRPGERVTPTGAAIVRYLEPARGLGVTPRRIGETGYGFGTRRFEGISNVLRALSFDTAPQASASTDQVSVLSFEVDDQTPEDLALGLERLRAQDGVLDVTQAPVAGKQGRLLARIQVLARPAALETIAAACFHETTTLGIRVQTSERLILPRREVTAAAGVRVKLAERGQAPSAKAELADLADADGHAGRERKRRAAESETLNGHGDDE